MAKSSEKGREAKGMEEKRGEERIILFVCIYIFYTATGVPSITNNYVRAMFFVNL